MKKVKLMNHDCLPILVLLYIAYLMLFTALFNAVCLYNTYLFFAIHFANAFCFHALSSLFTYNVILHHIQCLKSVGFLNFIFTPRFYVKGLWRL